MELRSFLRRHVPEDTGGQRPELGIGFKALRLVELKALARKFNLYTPEFDRITAETLASRMQVWWLEGRFGDGPDTVELSEAEILRQKMEAQDIEMAEMRDDIVRMNKGQPGESKEVTKPDVGQPDPEAPLDVSVMSWTEFQKYAKGLGVDIYGLKRSAAEEKVKAAA